MLNLPKQHDNILLDITVKLFCINSTYYSNLPKIKLLFQGAHFGPIV